MLRLRPGQPVRLAPRVPACRRWERGFLPTIPDSFEGPPGYLHGGIIATLLDEIMSKSVRARGLTAMTRRMEIDYLRPVPSGAQLRMEGRLVRGEGRKHWAKARILNPKGDVLAEGKGLFIEIRGIRIS